MATAMARDELDAFLAREDPALLAALGCVRRDGSPHVVPLWYRWDGERILVWTTETRGWVKNVIRDPRVSVSVQEGAPPFAAVIAHGHAETTTGDDRWISDEILRITRRYIPSDEVEAYVAGWPDLRTIVAVVPESVNGWSRGY
jgi:PPOX class probable F420-dependent enzyme